MLGFLLQWFFCCCFFGGGLLWLCFFSKGVCKHVGCHDSHDQPLQGQVFLYSLQLSWVRTPPFHHLPTKKCLLFWAHVSCFCCFQTWQLRTSINHSKCFIWRRNPWDFRENRYTYTYKPCFKWAKKKKPPSTGAHRIKSAIHSTWWLIELVVRTLGFSPQLTPIGWFN